MIKPLISMIVAMGADRTIGKDNKIPWDIPEDMEYLRMVTREKPLIMGRTTYESICGYRNVNPKLSRAMPARYNVMVTRDEHYFDDAGLPEGVGLATTPKDGLSMAYDFAHANNIPEIFVFGGAEIYKQLLPETERLYLTEIEGNFNGDTFFPEFNRDEWTQIKNDQRNGYAFNIYDRELK